MHPAIELEQKFGTKNYDPLQVIIVRGKGVWLYDEQDTRYLDCLSAYSAVNQGHCHPKIIETLEKQARKLTLISRAFMNNQLGYFCKELCELTNSHRVLPMNSGAEAVESCIKAVRKWGYITKNIPKNKAEIIVCENNFHGRTVTIVGFSTEKKYTQHFGPFTPGFTVVPYGDATALETAINTNTVGVLLEPIQGEAGVIIPPDGYLRQVREICTTHNILMITDEIQTGLGRTGKLLAEEYDGIEADLTLLGKALSGGFYPVSAVLSNSDVLGVFQPGEHGSTFAGNPLACAVSRTALRIIEDEGLVENSATMGSYLINELRKLKSDSVKEIRGKGLMIGIELHKEAGLARAYCQKLQSLGLLCKDTHEQVIRIAPPLVIQKNEVDFIISQLEKIL